MEDNKYYVPELEEFCVGFECEIGYGGNWQPAECEVYEEETSEAMIDTIHAVGETINKNIFDEHSGYKIRVKYLCREDIESLGWLPIRYKNVDCYGRGPIILSHIGGIVSIDKYSIQIFRGTVKNKTELKKLMKMLGIL